MSAFEYLLPFISVLVGLAVTDLATSLHRLLRARRRVKWDGLPLATALLALLTVLNAWWGLYAMSASDSWTLAGFLPLAALLFALFLLNAAALPDAVPSEGVDLQAFYESNGPYFWGLFVVYIFSVGVINVMNVWTPDGRPEEATIPWILAESAPNLVLMGVGLALALFRTRFVHAIVVVVLLVVFAVQWSDRVVGAV